MIRAVDPAGRPSPEETRLRILAATRGIYSRNGTRGTTTREIAEVAGVNEATLFRHFRSKIAIIEAMRNHYCRINDFDGMLASLGGDITEDLRTIATALVESLRVNRDLICVSLAESELDPTSAESAWRGPSQLRSGLQQYMAARVADGTLSGDADVHARAFVGLLFSFVIARKLWELTLPGDRAIEYFVDLFLHGAQRQGKD